MGLSIHYSGTLKDIALLPQLVEELQDVCTSLNWHYHLFDDVNFKGICFSPPECEPLFFTFHNSAEIASPVLWQLKIEPITTISTKTQFAGIDAHRAVIKLLKHISARYFSVFELSDEGGYWEGLDEAVLQKQFSRYNFLLTAVSEAIGKIEKVDGETTEGLAERLEKMRGENDFTEKKDDEDKM